jgi:hypothetical protein
VCRGKIPKCVFIAVADVLDRDLVVHRRGPRHCYDHRLTEQEKNDLIVSSSIADIAPLCRDNI